jgi:hypothetical protein
VKPFGRIRMTTAGLLALALCSTPGGSPYNAAPRPAALPADESGWTKRADVSGRVSLVDGVVVGPVAPAVPAAPAVGAVYEPAYTRDPDLCGPTAAYVPQAGDIVLVVSDHPVWRLLFAIALTHEPYHVGIVVAMPCGGFGLLEAGPPDESPVVRITPLAERLAADKGRVFIRRRCSPLTAEQSDALTGFALRQEGKLYAYIRFLAQGTPIRSRGPIRTHFCGKSRGEPCTYFCSELVMEALVSVGLVDAETARPRSTTPADIFFDESTNPWINKYLKLYPCWCPPQRWVTGTCGCGK